LYIGKALHLKQRVRQYFSGSDERTMVPHLVEQTVDIEIIITDTEKEALLLEHTLIHQHLPRYNVRLRDDASHLLLRIDPSSSWPRYRLVRHTKADGARYFGPYTSAAKARHTYAFLQRTLPLRTCSDAVLKQRSRPCLLHQMGRCAAPCVGAISTEEYQKLVTRSLQLLSGKSGEVVKSLKERMKQHAEKLEFEQAGRLRDVIAGLQATLERQKVIDPKRQDRDVWGWFRDGARGAVGVIPFRNGHMERPCAQVMKTMVTPCAELLGSMMIQHYGQGAPVPSEILLPFPPEPLQELQEILSEHRGSSVRLHVPARGKKQQLVALALENTRQHYLSKTTAEERHQKALSNLASLLHLEAPPHRMECFDNSNLGGQHPVAAMSVFLDGRPSRKHYRRYRIKTVTGSDDYASMREVLSRRLKRGLEEDLLPDLVVVDGGPGQLKVATSVLQDLGMHEMPVCSLSKGRAARRKGHTGVTDQIWLPEAEEPVEVEPHSPGLRLLMHIRDESHSHAIRYHRKVRRKNTLVSALEGIEGIGPSRRKALLRTLGSTEAVASSNLKALAAVPGIGPDLARRIMDVFNPPSAL
jgi:excinuclease ABC subunit C